jgi:hypothetical protein
LRSSIAALAPPFERTPSKSPPRTSARYHSPLQAQILKASPPPQCGRSLKSERFPPLKGTKAYKQKGAPLRGAFFADFSHRRRGSRAGLWGKEEEFLLRFFVT